MDVLCTDKTGTLTMDQVILERHCDVVLSEDDDVLALAYLNSHFQTGLKNVLDRAVLAHAETHAHARVPRATPRSTRSRSTSRGGSCRSSSGRRRARTASSRKGAPEAIFPRCANFELDGELLPMDHAHIEELKKEYEQLERRRLPRAGGRHQGRRAAGRRRARHALRKDDECDLILEGYVAFLDPPKDTAPAAISALAAARRHGQGPHRRQRARGRKVCTEVGLADRPRAARRRRSRR